MLAFFTGFLGGLIHVIAGPDHLAAIAPLAVDEKKSSWNIGLRWGFGHTGGVILIGSLIISFRKIIPIDSVSSYSERLVGIILILIGVWGLQKIFSKKVNKFEHVHDNISHVHFYNKKTFHTHTAFFIGIIHGLAGSSHFIGILPALAMPSQAESILYLIAFGFGNITAMTIFSALIGNIAAKFSGISLIFYNRLLAGFSFSAVTIGCIWLII